MADDIVYDEMLGELRTGDVSGGTGGESYVAGEGIAINGNTISATGGGGDVTEAEFKNLSDGTQSISKDVTEARHVPGLSGTPLTLLHFSDIHADSSALGRIMADKTALGTLVDDAICTGDIVANTGMSISSWWNSSVLTCIGNHDTATYSADTGYNWTAVSMAQRDAWYIAPYESNWSITHTSGTSYYYKDYSTQKVRLIVVDVMLYMSDTTSTEAAAQTSWLSSLLADAITNSLHVLIAIHAPHGGAVPVKCSFTKLGQGTMPTYTDCNTPDTIINTVATAIASGLKFIGYLVGHTHQDNVWDATGDRTQLMYCVTCAAISNQNQWKNGDMTRSTSLDAFNLVTIDTTNSRIKIVRGGGANIDNRMRKREQISVDYSTGKVIDYEMPGYATEAGTAETAVVASTASTALGLASTAVDFGLQVDGGTASLARFRPVETVTDSAVTLMAGHAYRLEATSAVTLNTETVPSGYRGIDGYIDIFTTSASYIVPGQNVVIKDTIAANVWNSCVVRFASGVAKIYVIDTTTVAYIVVQNTDLTSGSLYFGLTDSSVAGDALINFDANLDGATINFSGATVTAEKHVVGNGIGSTTLTGSVGVGTGGALDLASCTLNNTEIVGGNVGIGASVAVADGATVTVTSGGIAAADVLGGTAFALNMASGTVVNMTGNVASELMANTGTNTAVFGAGGVTLIPSGGTASSCLVGGISTPMVPANNVFDFAGSGTIPEVSSGAMVTISGATFANGVCDIARTSGVGDGGFMHLLGTPNSITSCTFVGGTATSRGGAVQVQNNLSLGYVQQFNDCIFSGCSGTSGGAISHNGGYTSAVFSSCKFLDNRATNHGGAVNCTNGKTLTLIDCEIAGNTVAAGGQGGAFRIGGPVICTLSSCYFHDNANVAGTVYDLCNTTITGCTFASNEVFGIYGAAISATISGHNKIAGRFMATAKCIISSGATIDCTGNTWTNVISAGASGIEVPDTCTVITSGGVSVTITGPTAFTVLKNDGTTA